MAEARDKNETFKNILLELQTSNATLDRIDTNIDLSVSRQTDEAVNKLVANTNSSFGGGSGSDSILECLRAIKEDTFKSVNALNAISQVLSDTYEANKKKALDDAEARLEAGKNKQLGKPSATIGKSPGGPGLLGILGSISGFVFGAIEALMAQLARLWSVTKIGPKIFKMIGIDKFVLYISKWFRVQWKIVGKLLSGDTRFAKLMNFKWLTKLITDIKMFFKPIADVAKYIGSLLPKTRIGSQIGSIFKNLKNFMGSFAKFAKSFGIFRAFGNFIGKWLIPVIAAFKGVTAFMNTKGGMIDKLTAGLKAAAVSIVTSFAGLLDLPKNIISWVIGALGGKEIEKWLDTWSFADIAGELVKRVVQMGQDIFETLFGNIYSAFTDVYDKFVQGDILGGVGAIVTGLFKIVVGSVFDTIKGIMANVAGVLGMNKAEKALNEFSFSEQMGGSHLKTSAQERPEGKSLLADASAKTVADRAGTSKPSDSTEEGADDPLANIQDAEAGFMDTLLKAYDQHDSARGAVQITPGAVNTTGAEISAMQKNTADMQEAYSMRAGAGGGASVTKNSTVSNSNNSSSVMINSTAMPDRTAQALRPAWAYR